MKSRTNMIVAVHAVLMMFSSLAKPQVLEGYRLDLIEAAYATAHDECWFYEGEPAPALEICVGSAIVDTALEYLDYAIVAEGNYWTCLDVYGPIPACLHLKDEADTLYAVSGYLIEVGFPTDYCALYGCD